MGESWPLRASGTVRDPAVFHVEHPSVLGRWNPYVICTNAADKCLNRHFAENLKQAQALIRIELRGNIVQQDNARFTPGFSVNPCLSHMQRRYNQLLLAPADYQGRSLLAHADPQVGPVRPR